MESTRSNNPTIDNPWDIPRMKYPISPVRPDQKIELTDFSYRLGLDSYYDKQFWYALSGSLDYREIPSLIVCIDHQIALILENSR